MHCVPCVYLATHSWYVYRVSSNYPVLTSNIFNVSINNHYIHRMRLIKYENIGILSKVVRQYTRTHTHQDVYLTNQLWHQL